MNLLDAALSPLKSKSRTGGAPMRAVHRRAGSRSRFCSHRDGHREGERIRVIVVLTAWVVHLIAPARSGASFQNLQLPDELGVLDECHETLSEERIDLNVRFRTRKRCVDVSEPLPLERLTNPTAAVPVARNLGDVVPAAGLADLPHDARQIRADPPPPLHRVEDDALVALAVFLHMDDRSVKASAPPPEGSTAAW